VELATADRVYCHGLTFRLQVSIEAGATARELMTALTQQDAIAALGSVDDVVVARIIGLGSTREELAEAQAWMSNNEAFMQAPRSLAQRRINRVIEIMAVLEDEDDEPRGT